MGNRQDSTPLATYGKPVLSYLSYGKHDPRQVATSASPGTIYLQVPMGSGKNQPTGIFQKVGKAAKDTDWIKIGGSQNYANTILNGTTPPNPQLGNSGDFYIDYASSKIYGPKLEGSWGAGISLRGEAGPKGDSGSPGEEGQPGIAGDNYFTGYGEFTEAQIEAKRLILPENFASATEFEFEVLGGGNQNPGVDFLLISPNVLSWEGLTLDGLVESGERFFLNYKTMSV